MAYVNVPKDLTKVKTKVLFNLTKRQLICFGSGALIGVPLFFLLKGSIGTSPAAMVMMVVMIPAMLFAMYEKNGSGIIEKLVSSGFVERRKSKKITNLLPTSTGTALITVLPEQLQSPQLTAEWEHRLKEIERGEIAPDSFMDGIAAMLNELVQTYKPIPGAEVLFPSGREAVGKCPRCGAEVTESQKGFFCENRACSFVLWKNSRFFTAKKKVLTKSLAAALLKNGCAPLKGCYSEKTGKTYDAVVLLEDDGQRTGYKLVFDNG